MKIGCQTYTWEMLGPAWTGSADDILDAVASAGYDGVEFSNAMIGQYRGRPDELAVACRRRGLAVAAFAYATTGFTHPDRFQEDVAGAVEAIEFCAALGVPLCLGGAASPRREPYEPLLSQAICFYGEVAERGRARGVTVCVHPHSHHGSLLESAEEYDRLLAATESSGLQFNPDAGHIVRGGQDLMGCLRRHAARIAHVHIKDVDAAGRWRPLGQGIIPWAELFGLLREIGYQGWVVAEEESAEAPADPAGAIRRNRDFLRGLA